MSYRNSNHHGVQCKHRIVIKHLPKDVPLEILTNATALHISQALKLSLRFTDSYSSGYIEMIDNNDRLVGQIWLASRRSSRHDPHARRRCEGYGFVELFDANVMQSLKAVAVLNDMASKNPLQVLNIMGKVVKAEDLIFLVEKEDRNRARDQENEDNQTSHSRRGSAPQRSPLTDFTLNNHSLGRLTEIGKLGDLQERWVPPRSSMGLERIHE